MTGGVAARQKNATTLRYNLHLQINMPTCIHRKIKIALAIIILLGDAVLVKFQTVPAKITFLQLMPWEAPWTAKIFSSVG